MPNQQQQLLKRGTRLVDMQNNEWIVDNIVGRGGFGVVYSVLNHPYVAKVEPRSSGGLFVETNFYSRSKGYDIPGVPKMIAFGSEGDNRFIILPRYGQSILTAIEEQRSSTTNPQIVYRIANFLLDSLKGIHSVGYVHNDLKLENVMIDSNDPNKLYVVDFGLATKFMDQGRHNRKQIDKGGKHAGTLIYTSKQSHEGVRYPSRAADLEILGYVLLEMLCGELPWTNRMTAENIYKAKREANLTECITDPVAKRIMTEYFGYVESLSFAEAPNYGRLQKLFGKGIVGDPTKIPWEKRTASVLHTPSEPRRSIPRFITPQRLLPRPGCEKNLKPHIVELATSLGVQNTRGTKRQICDRIMTHLNKCDQTVNIPPSYRNKSTKKAACDSISKELQDFAREQGVPVVRSRRQLCASIMKCMAQSKTKIVTEATKVGIHIGRKTKKDLCEELIKGKKPLQCMDLTKPEIVHLARHYGIKIGSKTKQKLCDELKIVRETRLDG